MNVQKDKDFTIHIFSACFYKKLSTEFNPVANRKLTKKTFLNVFISVCVSEHWLLVIVVMENKSVKHILTLDSMSLPGVTTQTTRQLVAKRVKG